MYDHEKSDPAIVAVKPTNKAGQPAAELVEPRAGAEGNVNQQSTGRAQYRGTVSQALRRIRQAARQRKKEKFTALFHHVSIDHLEEAFFELKENAAPGVDGLTCRDAECPERPALAKRGHHPHCFSFGEAWSFCAHAAKANWRSTLTIVANG